MRECDGIIHVAGPRDYEFLEQYNSTHRNYVLIYNGNLTSEMINRNIDDPEMLDRRIQFADCCNASVFIEVPFHMHEKKPGSHWGGALRETGKLLMTGEDINWEILDRFVKRQRDANAGYLREYPIKTRVTVSERQQKGIVEIIEE